MDDKRKILELALIGLETERRRIEGEIAELSRRLGRGLRQSSDQGGKRRWISAAHKRKISEAMKARWAERRNTGAAGRRKTKG